MSKKNKSTESQAPEAVSDQFSKQVVEQRLTPNPLNIFAMDKDTLRLALVTAQFALRATRQQTPPTTNKPTGLLVLVNGMEQAGKGTAVTQLRQWVDPRLLKVEATIGDCPLEHQPIWQAHTKALPRRQHRRRFISVCRRAFSKCFCRYAKSLPHRLLHTMRKTL